MGQKFTKVLGGLERVVTGVGQGLLTTAGAAITGDALGGPVGAAIGAATGLITSAVGTTRGLVDYINSSESGTDINLQDMKNRVSGAANQFIMKNVANGNVKQGADVLNSMIGGVSRGMSVRSAFSQAGGHQFARAIHQQATNALAKKAEGFIGTNATMATALGNGALKTGLIKSGMSTVHRNSVIDHILGSSLAESASALASNNIGRQTAV